MGQIRKFTKKFSYMITKPYKVYKFVGVNVAHLEFIKRYARLGPREVTRPAALEGADMQAMTCEKLATGLLLRKAHDPDPKSKFEVGRTKIFIRYFDCLVDKIDCASSRMLRGLSGKHERPLLLLFGRIPVAFGRLEEERDRSSRMIRRQFHKPEIS